MSNTDEGAKGKAVAKHLWLDAQGNVVEDIELAHGIRYVSLANGGTVDFLPKSDHAKRMGWCFGYRTLATNEASATRQRDGTPQDELDAIAARFALIEESDPPQWVDRTREGGPRIELPVLAKAMIEVLVEDKLVPADQAAGAEAKVLAKFESDKAQVAKARSNPRVEARYKALKGGKSASESDLAAMLA